MLFTIGATTCCLVRLNLSMRRLIPNITLIKGNTVPFQKGPVLILKRNRFMMRFLVGNILGNGRERRFGHRESRVTILP